MKNLVHLRIEFGFSQEELAKLTGVSQPTISLIEQGKGFQHRIGMIPPTDKKRSHLNYLFFIFWQSPSQW